MHEEFGAAIDGFGEHECVAGAQEGHQRGGDRGHAGGEGERLFRRIPDGEPIFQHFEIGIVDARVDEMHLFAAVLLAQAVGEFERGLALFCTGEDEGGCLEQRRLQRALGQMRRVAIPHHECLGRKVAVADLA